MKKILFLRHGEADHPGPATWNHDSARPLSETGKERMALEALGMKKLGLPIDAIVTSPYVRTRQTAEIVSREYRLADRMTESEYFEPGGSYRDFTAGLRGISGDHVMVVGHAPDLGVWAGALTGADNVSLGKGWLVVARLHADLREGTARLWGVFPADVLVSAGRD